MKLIPWGLLVGRKSEAIEEKINEKLDFILIA